MLKKVDYQKTIISKKDIFACSVLFILALLSLRGAFYGIASPDESFYLTIPYRIIQGDALLVDEWHASQLSAFLLYLPMKLFLGITGSTDGIVLFFRCLFTLCQTLVAVFTYQKIRKYGFVPSLVSAAMFFLYVPENVRMLDYYTMSLMGIHVIALLFFVDEKPSKFKYILIGIIFACAVTAQPFNSIIYFLYCISVLVFAVILRKKAFGESVRKYLSLSGWIYITVGIFICAAVFIAFLLSQESISEIIANFGNLFGGKNHTLPFSGEGKTDMFDFMKLIKTVFGFTPVSFTVSLFVIVGIIADRKRIAHRKFWLITALTVLSVYFIASIVTYFITPAEVLFRPYVLFLLTFVVIVLKKDMNHRLFCLWMSGVIYTVFLAVISQALDMVGVIGCVISNTALCPAAKELYEEIKAEKRENEAAGKSDNNHGTDSLQGILPKALYTVTAVFCTVNILTGIVLFIPTDAVGAGLGRELFTATERADSGPLKGIYMSVSQHKEYNKILADTEEIKKNTDGKVLVASLIPWIYFCFDEAFPTFTSWYISEELYMYEEYYEDEEHHPAAIYVPETSFYWNRDYTLSSNAHSVFFRSMFECSRQQGEMGKILYVNKMK